jgi:hypothetical protein
MKEARSRWENQSRFQLMKQSSDSSLKKIAQGTLFEQRRNRQGFQRKIGRKGERIF